ncbi:MAG: polysaccharide pyruvyl transferase family protein [Candidatus Peribacteraceae bacterium]|nr:polysaccharide pyruvyl transferase family protein [Candidatus Peribacteraceae bacterium]
MTVQYVLVGNYGVGNFGDEALREYFLSAFPEANFLVLSAHPREGELPRLPAGIRSFFLTRWWRTLAALWKSDGLVFGGGTLFTDIESLRAPLLWWWHAFVCRLLRKPYLLAFQGIGPFKGGVGPTSRFALRGAGEWCARFAVAHAAFVSVRDQASFDRVKLWKKNTNIIQTADPVFSLFTAQKRDGSSQKLLVIIPRKNSRFSFTERAGQLMKSGTWNEACILSLQPEDAQEQEVCRSIAHVLSVSDSAIVPIRFIADLAAQVSRAGFVLSQRYHGALAALALEVPFEVVSQGEGDKLSSVSKMPFAAALALVSEGERQLRSALFPELSESGKIQS